MVLPDKAAEYQHSLGIHEVGPDRSNIERSDLRTLIRGADQHAIGPEAAVIYQQAVPGRRILGVVRIGSLEPGAGELKIEVEGVPVGRLEIHPVEYVLLVAVIVKNLKLRTIQETAGVKTVGGDEISPFFSSIGKIEAAVGVPNVP